MFWQQKPTEVKQVTTDLQPVWNVIGELKSQIVELRTACLALETQIATIRAKQNKNGVLEDKPKDLNPSLSLNPFKV